MGCSGLEVSGVEAGYGGSSVLRGVWFCAPRGAVTALLGPNGSGKTTLLRVAAGLLRPRRGRVVLNGRDLYALSPRERARLAAYAPAEPGRGLGQLVEEYVAAGLYPLLPPGLTLPRWTLERAREALALLDAGGLAARRMDTLSSGEAQRAGLAHASVRTPELLAVDEPTSHQDPRGWVLAARLLRLHASRGGVVLVATHDFTYAMLYADRVVVLSGGVVEAEGPPGEVLEPELIRRVYGVEVVEAALPGGSRVYIPWEPLGRGGGCCGEA